MSCEDENNVIYVEKKNYRTSEHLSVGEATQSIGIRATQIEYDDSPIFTNYDGIDNSVHIAIKELLDGKNPLEVRREYKYEGKIYIEKYEVRDMVLPHILGDYDVYQKYRSI